MFQRITSLAVLVLFAPLAWPQQPAADDDVVRQLAPAEIEKMLQTNLKTDKLNKRDFEGGYYYEYGPGASVSHFLGKGTGRTFLLYQIRKPLGEFKEKVTLEKLNDWNIQAVYSRAYFIRKGGEFAGVILEGTLPLVGGISRRQLNTVSDRMFKEFQRFEAFVGGYKNQPDPSTQLDHGRGPARQPLFSQNESFVSAPLETALQDEIAKDLPVAEFEAILKASLKKGAYTKREFKTCYRYELNEIYSIDYYHGKEDNRKFLLFQYNIPNGHFNKAVTLEMMNDWNVKAIFTRAYLYRGNDRNDRGYRGATLEATVSLDAGLSAKQFGLILVQIDQENRQFLTFVGGLKEVAIAPPVVPKEVTKAEVFRQGFPAQQADETDLSKSDTAWEVEWDLAPVRGQRVKLFRILSAKYMWKDSKGVPRSLIVVRNLQLAEAFTQYDNKLQCFLDFAKVPVTQNLDVRDDFLGPHCVGEPKVLATKNPDYKNRVAKEVHYDGLRWMSVYGKTQQESQVNIRARKGEKLVMWSPVRAGNYIYLIEYNFTDDGRIICRLGFTAHNFFPRQPDQGDTHPHIGCWRLDFDLSDPVKNQGGPEQIDLKLIRRVFKDGSFKIDSVPFPGDDAARLGQAAREGKAKWVAKEFTMLRAESRALSNGRSPIAYDLISTRMGTADDLLPIGNAANTNMDFINYDFWVTRRPGTPRLYHELPQFAADQPLAGQATTVWHSVPGLHVPRQEDFAADGFDQVRGLALTVWVEFILRPRNVFDSTPLYTPVR